MSDPQEVVAEVVSDADVNVDTDASPTQQEKLKSPFKRWTSEEDRLLIEGIEKFGKKNWKIVAQHIGTRDPAQCLQRWAKSVNPTISKGRWTNEEDARLLFLIRQFPTIEKVSWTDVSSMMRRRNSKQCRERWFNFLDPNVKHSFDRPWTKDEDEHLMHLYELLGSRWAKIASYTDGRTENTVKVRVKALLRWREEGVAPSYYSLRASLVKEKTAAAVVAAPLPTPLEVTLPPPVQPPTPLELHMEAEIRAAQAMPIEPHHQLLVHPLVAQWCYQVQQWQWILFLQRQLYDQLLAAQQQQQPSQQQQQSDVLEHQF